MYAGFVSPLGLQKTKVRIISIRQYACKASENQSVPSKFVPRDHVVAIDIVIAEQILPAKRKTQRWVSTKLGGGRRKREASHLDVRGVAEHRELGSRQESILVSIKLHEQVLGVLSCLAWTRSTAHEER